MKRIIFCISLFAFFGSQAQQINPVPDYVFSNKMSVGRNAVTDTAAYFSIGPRYGAIRGMMPPMVTDTASMSATKRNGLLIFSIQKNKYLYWDSVGSKWAEMAGTAGSAITGSGVAGYMPEFTTSTNLDTTRLYHSAGRFAIGSTTTTNGVFNVYGGRAYFDTSVLIGGTTLFANEAMNEVSIGTTTGFHALTVRTRTQASQPTRGIGLITSDLDSATSTGSRVQIGLNASTGNTTGRIEAFQQFSTAANLFLNPGGGEVIAGTGTDAGNYNFQVGGSIYNTTNAMLAATSGTVSIGTSLSGYKLDVAATSGNGIRYTATSTGNSLYMGDNAGTPFISTANASMLQLGTNNTERIRIKDDGEVLIGTTTDAGAYALQVAGAIYSSSGQILAAKGSGPSFAFATETDLGFASLAGDIISFINGGVQIMQFRDTGLRIMQGQIWVDGTGSASRPSYAISGSQNTGIFMPTSASLGYTVTGNERMRLQSDGELLINTTTDAGAYNLQVAGAIYNTTTITTGAPTGGSIKPWRLGEAATVSPTSPNRTIRVEIDGTVYYIHAKTTND